MTVQVALGADDRVATYFHAPVDVCAGRIDDGDAGQHEPFQDAPAHDGADLRQLDARVDGQHHLLVWRHVGRYRQATAERELDEVR